MGVAYKNFRSLNVDEAVVTGILRGKTKKDIEVFMPINSQMKDIDLVLMNIKNKKNISIQVKGSKAFEPNKNEVVKYGDGSVGWFFLKKDTIHKATADYFVFLIYVIHAKIKTGKKTIEPHTITIPTEKLIELCLKYKTPHPDRYSFYFWINPNKKIAFDVREKEEYNKYYVSEYLDEIGIEKMNGSLN